MMLALVRRPGFLSSKRTPDDLELLQRILSGSADTVTGMSDPAVFLAAVRDTQPDLLVMGLRFRGTTGFDLVEQAQGLLTMPVLAVTGLPDWALHNEPRSNRFAAIIYKPVSRDALLAQVHRLLASHHKA
jgi:DNA-binding response OmpR family regulator